MITFVVAFIMLILGYVFYGKFVDSLFAPNANRLTPSVTLADGVDYISMPTWKVFLIQFLNIAGTGPIFGAILGIMFGPAAYLWIVFGCIFAGAVHDYFTGMISLRSGGASIPEIVGDNLGSSARLLMRVLSLILLILVGAVFARTPANLIAALTPTDGFWGGSLFWLIVIIVYYIMATLLPIDKLIGRIYPLFGAALLIMAVGVCWGILTQKGSLPEITEAFSNHYPEGKLPVFPCLCITIACGAVSGFHTTQSPLMARCLNNEKNGRLVFYGAMITEGIVALIWAAGAIKFADSVSITGATPYEKLLRLMTENGVHSADPAILVNAVCKSWLGSVGAVLAVLGVVAAPITSGDTAFRSARLIASDFVHIKQGKISNRLLLALPLFGVAIYLFFIDFQILWRYFAWFNQTLACGALWTFTAWLARRDATNRTHTSFVTLIPALWMTLVSTTYICIAPEGFTLPANISYVIGAVCTAVLLVSFVIWNQHLDRKI
ncbi:MAG: carbon starvation CstA family protein [Bacteroidales bacterium]|nr:carbon starvation CstA family protein [Bacteroidales bacterium]